MVSTHLKNISQIGSFPQIGVKITNIWNHQQARYNPFTLQSMSWVGTSMLISSIEDMTSVDNLLAAYPQQKMLKSARKPCYSFCFPFHLAQEIIPLKSSCIFLDHFFQKVVLSTGRMVGLTIRGTPESTNPTNLTNQPTQPTQPNQPTNPTNPSNRTSPTKPMAPQPHLLAHQKGHK